MKMKKIVTALLAAAVSAGLLSGCGTAKRSAAVYQEAYVPEPAMMSDMMTYDAAAPTVNAAMKTAASGAADTSLSLPENRKWVITMSLNAETDNLDNALSALNERITAMSGYTESHYISNTSSYRRYRSASLTVRIPADRVDAFVSEVSGLTNVTSSSRNVRDITLSYTDTEGRLNALKVEEQRLLELMIQAENMSDLLEIESRLAEVRYRLESYGSQLRLYDNQVDYATVDISINEVTQYTPAEKPGFWQRITDGLADSIVDLGETIVDAVVWFIVDLPYLLVLALLAWGGIVLMKRSIRRRKAKKAEKKEEVQ